MSGDFIGFEVPNGFPRERLVSVTRVAGGDIHPDVGRDSQPPVSPGDEFQGSRDSWVSCGLGVMVGLEDFVACFLSNVDLPVHDLEPIIIALPPLGNSLVFRLFEE